MIAEYILNILRITANTQILYKSVAKKLITLLFRGCAAARFIA